MSPNPAHPHSTFGYGGGRTIRQYTYDDNGNMTQRIEGSDTYTFAYDQENRLVSGKKNSVTLASYTYDGDGRRVKAAEGSLTTVYIGDYYEWRSDSTTIQVKYYYANGQRIAMRSNGTLTWLLGDHLGSTTITANGDGSLATEQKYTAWGQTRSGSSPTDRQYTGQINEAQLGLYFYNARYYDSYLARFISPDSIIPLPGNPQAWDRYSYTSNNPINYVDPTGHAQICAQGDEGGGCGGATVAKIFKYYNNGQLSEESFNSALGLFSIEHPNYDAYRDPEIVNNIEFDPGAINSLVKIVGVKWTRINNVRDLWQEIIKLTPLMVLLAVEDADKGSDLFESSRITKITKAESPVWRQLDTYRGNIRTSGEGSSKRYFQWDYTHGDIEVYDSRGKHLGSMDARTGEMYKPAVPGRQIKP